MTFSEDLADWCDWDDAVHALGTQLGLFDGISRRHANSAIMTDNEFGYGLRDTVLALTRAGVLERRDEPDEQFRWAYVGARALVGIPDEELLRPTVDPGPEPAPTAAPHAQDKKSWWRRG